MTSVLEATDWTDVVAPIAHQPEENEDRMPRIAKTNHQRAARTTVAAVLVAAAAVCVGPTAPARASSIDVECLGSFGRTFSPAVTVASQRIRASITAEDQIRLVDRYASQLQAGPDRARGEARQ